MALHEMVLQAGQACVDPYRALPLCEGGSAQSLAALPAELRSTRRDNRRVDGRELCLVLLPPSCAVGRRPPVRLGTAPQPLGDLLNGWPLGGDLLQTIQN